MSTPLLSRFLTAAALEAMRKEEEEKEKADLELAKKDPWWALRLEDKKKSLERFWEPSSSSLRKRRTKRKKGKKKLPRVRPQSLVGLVCSRPRQASHEGPLEQRRLFPDEREYVQKSDNISL